MIRVAVPGAAGKMGQMVIEALLAEGERVTLAAALERRGHELVGKPAGAGAGAQVAISDDAAEALDRSDVLIDFTAPQATQELVELAATKRVAAVIGTTGLGPEARAAIIRAGEKIPIVLSPNFSLGVNLLLSLCEQAARTLGHGFDLEVVEIHHKMKRDAPSGTAIAMAEALARGRELDLAAAKRYAREGDVGPRRPGEIGVVAVRGGDVIGEHTALFLGPAERIELVHRAGSRAIFARGAVRAAQWVVGQPPGVYSMKDVLAL